MIENRKIGIILIAIAIVIASSTAAIKIREDSFVEEMVAEQGSCFLEDGTCMHEERGSFLYFVSWIFSAALAALGAYMIFFEKSQAELVSALGKQKEMKIEEEKFDILMKGLDADEQKVMKAVREQDGITQQTLRLRADMHKSKLSITLDRLEKKGLVKRVEKGKTNQVFMKVSL